MKKIAFASIAAGFVMSFASAASAASYEQTFDLHAYELGGVGVVTQMQVDRTFVARGVRNVQPTNATRATNSGISIGYNLNIADRTNVGG